MGCWLLMDSFQMPIPTHQLLCPSLPSLEMRPTNQKPVSITSVRKYHFCVMLQEKPSWSPELCIACEHRLGVQSFSSTFTTFAPIIAQKWPEPGKAQRP